MEGKMIRSHRPLIIASVVFIIIVVIVGAVVWKVTKDAYEESDDGHVKTKTVTDGDVNDDNGDGGDAAGNKGGNGKGTDGDGGGGGGDQEITEEELRKSPWKRLRLPRNILPVQYDITMYPDFYGSHGEFYGNETIQLKVTSPSKYLFIHIQPDYINITNSAVHDTASNEPVSIQRTFIYRPNQFFVIEADGEFNDLVSVHLQFEGSLTKSIVGIYKSTYVNSQTNQTRNLATSKFEPTFARRAFPCLDEPNMKANFTISLVHQKEYTALSNMDIDMVSDTTINGEELVTTKFHPSVKMSTYLVCFIVCDFESISTQSKKNTKIRVFATPDKQDQTQYALEMVKHTLDLYEEKFEIDYPLPKLDLIAIPDFVSGAMEHWGLITFRDSALLYNPDTSTLSSKKRVATVVAHEVSHQWFGNLVTMDWWNDLWLNEGFASYMEYIGTKGKETDWDMDSQFLIDDLIYVMGLDDVISTHPIVVTVTDPSEITSVFDAISYSKGASVIRMLEHIIGTDNFFKGVANYLKKYEWGNARTDDLWNSLTEVDSSVKVKEIMDTWTIQDGYPYVNISMTTTANGKSTFKASQHRFLSDPQAVSDPSNSPFGYKWYIYLDYIHSGGSGSGLTTINKTEDVEFEVPVDLSRDTAAWIKFNKDKKGFYRVLYPDLLWTRLSDYLLTTNPQDYQLSASDRADVLNDAFELAAAGLASYEVPLNLVQYLKTGETHYVPWKSASGDLSYISEMLADHPDYDKWRAFRLGLVSGALDGLNKNDTSFLNSQLHARLFSIAAQDGKTDVMNDIKQQFRAWLDKGQKPPITLRSVIYAKGMATIGTDQDWHQVWDKYTQETNPSEKGLLLRALASTSHPNLIAKLLENALRLDGIREQDFFVAVQLVGYNTHASHMVWDWMQENYAQMERRFTVMDRNFGRMAYRLVKSFKTPLKLQEVKDFFSQHPNEGTSARYRKMAIESITKNIQWLDKNRGDILNWIHKNSN